MPCLIVHVYFSMIIYSRISKGFYFFINTSLFYLSLTKHKLIYFLIQLFFYLKVSVKAFISGAYNIIIENVNIK